MLSNFVEALKGSKRAVTGLLTIVAMFAYNHFNLVEYGMTEDTVNNMVMTVCALIIGDSLRPTVEGKKDE